MQNGAGCTTAAYRSKHVTKGKLPRQCRHGSFFATLKSEFFYPNRFESVDSLRDGVEDYIRYYNNDRIRMKLKGLSPVQYRTQP